MSMTRIAVIGAGISGISMAKSLLAKGVNDFTLFEADSDIGGNWNINHQHNHSSAYDSLHINTSKSTTEYPDFPMPANYPTYCHHSQIKEYLENVVDHFAIRRHIQFNTRVISATPQGQQWQLKLDDDSEHQFDYLVVANGHHNTPYSPNFKGEFSGQVLHSHDYKNPFEPIELRGKKILIIGIGNSAMDIACELSLRSMAERVCVSSRHSAYIIPKYLFGKPVDTFAKTIHWLPYWMQRRALQLLFNVVIGKMENYGLAKPDHRLLEAHPSVSGDFLNRVDSGDITMKPDISHFDQTQVLFKDNSSQTFDVIIYATGYTVNMPFFSAETIDIKDNVLPLFKRCFHPDYANLAFIGMAQALPSLIRFIQLSSEFVAADITGEYKRPSSETMKKIIISDDQKNIGHYLKSRRHTMQIDTELWWHDVKKEWQRGKKRVKKAC